MVKFSKVIIIICLILISGCIFNKDDKIQENVNPQVVQVDNSLTATISTNAGDIKIKLFNAETSPAVETFTNLVQANFYNNQKFHKVIIDFIIQIGDPVTKGIHNQNFVYQEEVNPNDLPVAGSLINNENLRAEYSNLKFDKAGLVALVDDSQFFITLASTPWLNDKYRIFGEVVEGLEIAKKIEIGDWINNITINYPSLVNN